MKFLSNQLKRLSDFYDLVKLFVLMSHVSEQSSQLYVLLINDFVYLVFIYDRQLVTWQ